ncbi:centrosomal protein of 55 kDa-like [Patiria miniata]|uniref:Uncharacterized protein n=1 Tax=Patiria miniata TaxID=46514 RepID=A0A913Z721_PATMI|nr:centrosomal protein of 55 kDa-like [Patiria miniata]
MYKASVMCPTNGDRIVETKTAHLPSDMVSVEQFRLSQRQTAQMELENGRLASQLKEVVGMNTRWQRYDEQREAYVLKLHAANKELLGKLNALQKTYSELKEQISREKLREERPDLLKDPKVTEASNRTAPMCALDAKFARKEKEMATLTDQIERLEAQVAALQRSAAKRREDEEERIALFKAQLEVCMEDFRQERKDREKMNSDRLRLRKQLDEAEMTIARLHQEITDLVEETRWLRDRPSRLTHHYGETARVTSPLGLTHHYNYYATAPVKQNHVKRVGVAETTRQVGGYYGQDVPDDDDSLCRLQSDLTIDGDDRDGVASPTDRVNGATSPLDMTKVRDCVPVLSDEATGENPLKCPQCLVEFPVEKHVELSQHIELCTGDADVSSQ